MRLQSNLYLIGLMGAGKTTAGRKLARLLCCEFIDTDHALEKRTGVSINHIFEVEGEHGFRERETNCWRKSPKTGTPARSFPPAAALSCGKATAR